MGEVIVTPPRVREEEKQEEFQEVENQTEETQEEIQQQENSSTESEVIETQPEKEENMNSVKDQVQEKAEMVKEKASEIAEKVSSKPWIWAFAGAAVILMILIGTDHLIWSSDGPRLITISDAYEAGKARGIKSIESMPWYSRVWRGFTGDYHSK